METLVHTMRQALGSAFSLYLMTHGFHWNVEGADFYQVHKMFQDQYEEQWGAIDDIAERIRALDEYAPQSMQGLLALSRIQSPEYDRRLMPREMAIDLMNAHEEMICVWSEALALATAESEAGLANFIGARIEAHQKHRWMLRATAV